MPTTVKSENKERAAFVFTFLGPLPQVYTRSVIDPLPAPDGDAATKAADRQKKKGGKMTDEEIMEKLSTQTRQLEMTRHRPNHSYFWLHPCRNKSVFVS